MTQLLEKAPSQVEPAARSSGVWQRWTHGVKKLWQRADWARFKDADWPDHIMDAKATDDFHEKQGRSTGRLILENEGKRLAVYLKRHYELGWWRGWLATLFPTRDWSPAFQEMRRLFWAKEQGLPVPDVVVAGEFIGPRGRLQSVLAVEELTGMLGLHQAIPRAARQLDALTFRSWKRGLAAEMARLARFLHDRSYFHKDLYLCHFYVPQADICLTPACWQGRLHMIDFHRLARHRWTSLIWQIKDLGQLLFSSFVEGVDARDRLRFWRHYLGGARGAPFLTWCVRLKGRRYLSHNAKREP